MGFVSMHQTVPVVSDRIERFTTIRPMLSPDPSLLLSPQVADGQNVSFPFFMAFNSLLNNMELIKRIYLQSSNGSRTAEVTKGTEMGRG